MAVRNVIATGSTLTAAYDSNTVNRNATVGLAVEFGSSKALRVME